MLINRYSFRKKQKMPLVKMNFNNHFFLKIAILVKGGLVILFFGLVSCISSPGDASSISPANTDEMMVRIADIEIDSAYLEEYIAILKEESEASIRLEPGVISIFPMFPKEKATNIIIVEVYASREAYESHLQTPHFKHYKTATLDMVKSLKLIDMEAVDKENMSKVFGKLNS